MRRKKHKSKNKMLLWVLILLSSYVAISSFAKYVIVHEDKHIQSAERFYFTSSVLKEDEIQYDLNDWDVSNTYNIDFNLANYENKLKINQSDIEYEIYITNSSKELIDIEITGDITKQDNQTYTGVIAGNQTRDTNLKLQVSKKNGQTIEENGVNFEITAKAIEPYEKEIKASFILKAREENTPSIELLESSSKEYVNLIINNIEEKKKYTIIYDNKNLIPDTDNNIVELTLEAYESKNIKFIKKDSTQTINLGEDIIVEY